MMRAFFLAIALTAPAAAQQLTLEEKAAQLQNEAPAEPKLALPAYDWWNEGLHGLARDGEATVFPQAIGLAATWDRDLMQRVGDTVATEARAKWNARPRDAARGLFEGLTIWSPNINIFRDPRWGRGQETYGEDPYLTGSLATAFIRGLQGPDPLHPKTIATPKHLAVHSGPEGGRDSFSVQVSPRDLEATYLPAFRMAVTEGKAQSLMCAYNALHGTPVCADRTLMVDRLRGDWGFTGLTVSDCDAVGNIWLFHHSQPDAAHAAAAALKGGTDLNCGSTYAALPQAVRAGLVGEDAVDAALARAVAMRRRLTAPSRWDRIRPSAIGDAAARALAREAAEKSIVLLKNEGGLLPLAGRRIAVIGPTADDLNVLEANYHGTAIDPVTPLDGLRRRFGSVAYAQGSALAEGAPVVVPETALRSDGRPGLALTIERDGRADTRRDRRIDRNFTKAAPFRAVWTGEFVPPAPGRYRLLLGGVACWHACPPHDPVTIEVGGERRDGTIDSDRPLAIDLDATGPVPLRVTLDHKGGDEGLRLSWIAPPAVQRAEAVAATRDADVVVAFVGLSPDLEGEALKVAVPGFAGGDRTDVLLPEAQRHLLADLAATGRPLVVVVTAGSAVALGGARADAALYAWYPGVEGGTAIARVLAGDVSPSGRMPVTVYASNADLPAFVDYGMKGRTYRYFAGTPEWGFGHGLSYTRFAYDAPVLPASIAAGDSLTVRAPLANTGDRTGEEVVQAYLVPPPVPGERATFTDPVLQRQLVGFARVALKRDGRGAATFTIDPRAMSIVDRDGQRRVVPGDYRLWVGGGQPDDGAGVWTRFTVTGTDRALPR